MEFNSTAARSRSTRKRRAADCGPTRRNQSECIGLNLMAVMPRIKPSR